MSRTVLPLTLLAIAILESASAHAATPSAGEAAATRGQRLAERNCSQCHAIGQDGLSPNRNAPPFRTLHQRYPADSLQEAFERGLLTRHPAMPQMRFTPAELADLSAYFKAMRNRGASQASLEPLLRPVGYGGDVRKVWRRASPIK